jgi:hypothetical protein
MVDGQTLSFLLQSEFRVTVRNGSIVLGQHLYVSDDLARLSGCRVYGRWDPGKSSEGILVYPGDKRCLAVPKCGLAQYGAWGEANLRVKQGGKVQRLFIAEWSAEIKGACPRGRMDSFDAHGVVERRLALGRQQQRGESADLKAISAEAAIQEAAQKAAEKNKIDGQADVLRSMTGSFIKDLKERRKLAS